MVGVLSELYSSEASEIKDYTLGTEIMADFELIKKKYVTLGKEVETAMAELNLIEPHCIYAVAEAD